MDSANEMKERMARVFEQEQLEAVFPTFYQAIPEDLSDDYDGFIANCTVIEPDLHAHPDDTEERIKDSMHRLYYVQSCSHSHDCCGCWFTTGVKIRIEPTRNIYGSGKQCYSVTATFGYGRNV